MPDIDTLIAFENGELSSEEIIDFIQEGIDCGWVWKLQGAYGRLARHLLLEGQCFERHE